MTQSVKHGESSAQKKKLRMDIGGNHPERVAKSRGKTLLPLLYPSRGPNASFFFSFFWLDPNNRGSIR